MEKIIIKIMKEIKILIRKKKIQINLFIKMIIHKKLNKIIKNKRFKNKIK